MANNPYVNKVQTADGTTLIDISDTTALATDVLNSKAFYTASGQKVTGSAVKGLEYETGTFTPQSDVARPYITFANAHSVRPAYILLSDVTGTEALEDSSLSFAFCDSSLLLGSGIKTLEYKDITHDYSTDTITDWVIIVSGIWSKQGSATKGRAKIFEVPSGAEKVIITPPSSGSAIFTFLKTINNTQGATPDYAEGWGRTTFSGNPREYTLGNDCNYMYTQVTLTDGTDRTPQDVTFTCRTTPLHYAEVFQTYQAATLPAFLMTGVESLTGSSSSQTSISYWSTASGFYPYGGADTRYFRTGRTYKWIAVWAPTVS